MYVISKFIFFLAPEDQTAKAIGERDAESTSLNDSLTVDDDFDYEENVFASCDHSVSVIDEVPVTPKKPYRLLDPSK